MPIEPVLPTIISSDQTGFIHGHNSFNNLRHPCNVIYTNIQPDEHEVLISLDAEKAFNRAE